MIGRLAETIRVIACFVLLAISVHIATVLLVPVLSRADAFSTAMRLGPELRLIPLDPKDKTIDPIEDPDIAAAICSFDLGAGPVKVSLPVSADGFSSIALHEEGGGVFFALSNSAAEHGRLEIIALTPGQAVERAAEDDEDNPSGEVRATSSRLRGFAVFRALALLPSQRKAAAALVAGGSCEHVE
jgi:uncharacterized membrane protein